jgi:PAS domain S-box-containing protein
MAGEAARYSLPESLDAALRRELAADVFPAIRWAFSAGGVLVALAAWKAHPAMVGRDYFVQLAIFIAGALGVWLPIGLRLQAWSLTLSLYCTALIALANFGPLMGNAMILLAAVFVAAVFLGRLATAITTGLAIAGYALVALAIRAGLLRTAPGATIHAPEDWLRAGVAFSVTLAILAVAFERLLGAVTSLTRESRDSLRLATAAEASFRNLIEATPELVVIHRAGRTLYLNPAMRRLLGAAASAASESVLDYVHPDDLPMLQQRIHETGTLPNRSFRLRRRGGGYAEAEFIAIDVDYQGAPARVAIGRDVTDRNAVLARLTVSDRLASLGTLAAGVAHELNNPLSFVRANLDFIGAELKEVGKVPGLSPELLPAVEEAKNGADRMKQIVRDMRTLTRADDKPDGELDPRKALQWASALAMPLLRERARLEASLPEGLAIFGSEARLGQVLLNLLVNAAQAIPRGAPDQNLVRVQGRREGDRVLLEVSDTGPGMTEEVARRAFEPFFTTKVPGEGTGLGLWVCHNLVGAMGGELRLETAPGKGARFLVWLRAA